jgi:hypothetical protein
VLFKIILWLAIVGLAFFEAGKIAAVAAAIIVPVAYTFTKRKGRTALADRQQRRYEAGKGVGRRGVPAGQDTHSPLVQMHAPSGWCDGWHHPDTTDFHEGNMHTVVHQRRRKHGKK